MKCTDYGQNLVKYTGDHEKIFWHGKSCQSLNVLSNLFKPTLGGYLHMQVNVPVLPAHKVLSY